MNLGLAETKLAYHRLWKVYLQIETIEYCFRVQLKESQRVPWFQKKVSGNERNQLAATGTIQYSIAFSSACVDLPTCNAYPLNQLRDRERYIQYSLPVDSSPNTSISSYHWTDKMVYIWCGLQVGSSDEE